MNEEKKNKILGKLRKLMDLKESAKQLGNEGEANAAAAGISRLLMEYNLTENDIPSSEKEENPIVMDDIPYQASGHKGRWYDDLVQVVCQNNLCEMLLSGVQSGRSKRFDKFLLIGRKKNIEVVKYLISYLSNQFQRIGRMKYKEYREQCERTASRVQFMTSFLMGCIRGLSQQYLELKSEMEQQYEGTTALVLTNSKEIEEFKNKTFSNIGTRKRSSNSKLDYTAYKYGEQTGHDINLHSGLECGDTEMRKSIS